MQNEDEFLNNNARGFHRVGLCAAETDRGGWKGYTLTEEERKAVIAENFRRGLGHLLRLEGEES